MFSENLKALRKAKGLTQEELAARLHIVRQTVSKWEKGLSVPDAELLIRLAEALDTTVSRLLGADIPEDEASRDRLAEQLSRINEQLAVRNRRGRFVLRLVLGILGAIVVFNLLLVACGIIVFRAYTNSPIIVTQQVLEP
ncbi:MAG TPA: helix-turn-helix domain-containing protein [Firmicutes bacterium]|nr:helix-turn-helix domain-containing protein [Bacillota bacterium]